MKPETASFGSIEPLIRTIRDQKVILDRDLARIYGVPAKRLNEQVKRNLERFPPDFMFQLTAEEFDSLRSQIATLKLGRGQHRIQRLMRLLNPPPEPESPRRQIGFHTRPDDEASGATKSRKR